MVYWRIAFAELNTYNAHALLPAFISSSPEIRSQNMMGICPEMRSVSAGGVPR